MNNIMRHYHNIKALLLTAMLLMLTACSNDDDDRLFSDSSAQRVNITVAQCRNLLESAEDGWAIDFYPYDTSWGGQAMAGRFADGKVSLCAEYGLRDDLLGRDYPAGTEFCSVYQVKGEQGVILTFSTYNTVMHYWSEPFGDDAPDGYMSDYEFMLMEMSHDRIVLRGKKYGNTLTMTRLNKPATEYILDVVATHTSQLNIPRKRITAGGNSVGITISGTVLTLDRPDDNGRTTVPFTYTATGLRFYKPVTIGGVTMSDFSLDSSGNLVEHTASAAIPYPTPAEIFTGAATPWYLDYYLTAGTYNMSEDLRTLFLAAEAQAEAIPYYSNRFVAMTLGRSKSYATGRSNYPFCIGWEAMQSRRYEPLYIGYDVTFDVVADNMIGITPIGPGAYFLPSNTPNYNKMLMPLTDYLIGKAPYRITEGSIEGMRLESAADPSCWFVLTATDPHHWFD